MTPLEVARGLSGEDVSVAASGTDRAWRIGMTFLEAVVGAPSGGDASFASVDGPATMADHMWIVGRSTDGGAEPFVAMENAEEGVRWSLSAGGGTNDGPVRRPWLAERQRPFAATMEWA